MSEPRISVLVVSYDTRDDLLRCLASLEPVLLPLEVIVADNASTDGSADAVAERFPASRLIRNRENVGFARACNQALALARAPAVLLLNSDAEVRPGAVEALLARLESDPTLGAVGPRIVDAEGAPEVSFGPDLTPLAEWHQRRLVRGVKSRRAGALQRARELTAVERRPDWLSAACLLARRDALRTIGGFDEAFFLYEEDADLGRRLRAAGFGLLFTPAAQVVHHLGRSMARDPLRARLAYEESHLHYYAKHNGAVATAVLRALIAGRAAMGWAGAALRGHPSRGPHRAVLRVALGRRRPGK